MSRALARADAALFRAVRSRARGRPVAVARAYSALGQHAAVWIALGLAGAALDPARRGRWRRGAAVVVGTYALNTAIKLVVCRRRPRVAGLPALVRTPTQLSFPSAHASSSFAAARVYSGLLPAAPLHAAAALMAASRVYLGAHYPGDVAAGAALGLATGSLGR